MNNAEQLVSYIRQLGSSFQIVSYYDGNYNHMGATLTDGILQAGTTYRTVVAPRVQKLIDAYPEARTTSDFCQLIANEGVESLLKFRGKKPALISHLAHFFKARNIETEDDLKKWLIDHRDELIQIKGIKHKTADYFKILVGLDASAVDRHLTAFVNAAGIAASDYNDVQTVIDQAASALNVPRAILDHSIWRHLSNKKTTVKKGIPKKMRPGCSKNDKAVGSERCF